MAKANGHSIDCGCPSCIEEDSAVSTDALQSRMSDNPNDQTSSAATVLRSRGATTREP